MVYREQCHVIRYNKNNQVRWETTIPKGPILNDISKSFTTRDNLGIEGVATTIQASICPIINTVTPRVFYWPFLV